MQLLCLVYCTHAEGQTLWKKKGPCLSISVILSTVGTFKLFCGFPLIITGFEASTSAGILQDQDLRWNWPQWCNRHLCHKCLYFGVCSEGVSASAAVDSGKKLLINTQLQIMSVTCGDMRLGNRYSQKSLVTSKKAPWWTTQSSTGWWTMAGGYLCFFKLLQTSYFPDCFQLIQFW